MCAALLAACLCALSAFAEQTPVDQLNAQVAELYRQGKYAEALPIAAEALQVAQASFGPGDSRVAITFNNLAEIYEELGRFAEAEPMFQSAIRINEVALGPDHPDLASELGNLATLYVDIGRYSDAEPLYLRTLHIDEKALGTENPGVAVDLNNLALLYDHEGRYSDAEPLYQRALHIDEKALGPDHPYVAVDLDNLAALYYKQGHYAGAEPLFQRALHIDEMALGPDHPTVADNLNNLALLTKTQGGYAEAESLYQRALSIDEKALGPDHPTVATELNNLAELYSDMARYSEAEPLYQRSLHIREGLLGPDHPDFASSLSNLATLYRDQGKFPEAQTLFERAQFIYEKALGPDHPLVASALNNLASVDSDQGKYRDAEPLYQRALRIQERAFGPDDPILATQLANLANLDVSMGRPLEADSLYQRVFDNIFAQFQSNFSYMTEKQRLEFLGTIGFDFPAYFSFVHRFREKDPELVGSMYDLLLWEKGLIAGSIADMRRQVEASGDPEALKLLGQLSGKRTQIAALLNAKPPDLDLWRKQIDQLKTEANDIEQALVARSSAFAARRKLERSTWQDVRDALKPGDAAVEFVRFNFYDKKWTGTSYYVALVVTRDTKDQPEYIFLGDDKQIEGAGILSFQHTLQTRGFIQQPEAMLPGKQAYDLIWEPLEKVLAGTKRVYFSPDGALNEIPLGIIPAPDGKLQMEKYDLRLVSSTRDLLRTTPPHVAATALLVGDPVFDLSEEQQRAAIEKLALPQQQAPMLVAAFSPNGSSRDLGSGSTLPRLPATGAEVAAIATLMQSHNWKTSVYMNQLALKTVVEQASGPRVVHLATHGFFLPDQQIKADAAGQDESQPSGLEDPMLRSGLFFAGADRTLAGKPSAEGLDNGVLTALEAGNLNLRGTELVVLSACNTGQGDVKNGEGVFGLRRALEEAGTQSILMSLWSVPDKETLELMKRFYTKWLAGMEIHEALKRAQLEMREGVKKSHDGNDLPYYWGAFVLVGR
jgi:CHAT domain-containing protein/Tfp pilus assembly protein PilF